MAERAQFNREALGKAGKGLLEHPLTTVMREWSLDLYNAQKNGAFYTELAKIYADRPLSSLHTKEEYLVAKLKKSITALVGNEWMENIEELTALRTKGAFSTSMYRKSFRTADFGYYAADVTRRLGRWIHFAFYEQSIVELLDYDPYSIGNFEDWIALEINHGNTELITRIRDMILGDNNHLLSRQVIDGIHLSDNAELKELLKKLLLAAKGQEGLRQAILESADTAGIDTLKGILQCCVDNDLFRFSSAVRALYTWTGLYNEAGDGKLARRLGETALACLKDPQRRKECLASKDPFEMYLALWAEGCEEIRNTDGMIGSLLSAEETCRKYLGWYFVYHIENPEYRHKMAVTYLNTDDPVLLALSTDNLYLNRNAYSGAAYNLKDGNRKLSPDPIYPDTLEERKALFARLKEAVVFIGSQEWKINGHLFPWQALVINNTNCNAMPCMMGLAAYDMDEDLIAQLHDLMAYMDSDRRRAFLISFLDPSVTPQHRQWLYEGLKDRSPINKEAILKKLSLYEPAEEDFPEIAAMLKTQNGSLRKAVTRYMSALSQEQKSMMVKLLLKGVENQLQSALELLIANPDLQEAYQKEINALNTSKLSDQTMLLLEQLKPQEETVSDSSLLYGLYDPSAVENRIAGFKADPVPYLAEPKQLKSFCLKAEEVCPVFDALLDVIRKHADYEYKVIRFNGQVETILFGDLSVYWHPSMVPAEYGAYQTLVNEGKVRLSMVPFHEEFEEVLKDLKASPEQLVRFYVGSQLFQSVIPERLPWFEKIMKTVEMTPETAFYRKRYGNSVRLLGHFLGLLLKEVDQHELFVSAASIYFGLIHVIGEEHLTDNIRDPEKGPRYLGHSDFPAGKSEILAGLRSLMQNLDLNDADFKLLFTREYALEAGCGYGYGNHIPSSWYLRAVDVGILDQEDLYAWLLHEHVDQRGLLKQLTIPQNPIGRGYREQYPWLKESMAVLIKAAVRFEAARGQAETPISSKVNAIMEVIGAEYFVLFLKALGSEHFYRGYSWTYSTVKNEVISSLLKHTFPSPEDTAASMKKLLKESSIKEQRLIEAAMYAPQWAALVEEITGWKGLRKAVWYFHAHISEHFSAEKETEVARYSPISPKDFNDGVFDIAWYRESYAELGEKRFQTLYKNAKYITSGSNNHRRSQLYADAAGGKLKPEELEQEITEKRSQERLRAYAVIPLKNDADLLHRYEYICRFRKESRQFGSQRKESERRAADCALQNLAITSGIFDVNRMLWKLEKAKLEEIRPLMEGAELEGYTVTLVIDEEGDSSVVVSKDGKPLKTIPKALAKNSYVEQLKETVKDLKDQKARSRMTLEEAMISRTLFTCEEMEGIMSSLTIAPMAEKLLWSDGTIIGFARYQNDRIALVDADGVLHETAEDTSLYVVHPYHLLKAKCWASFMHVLYETRTVQPFRQVFREYYPLIAEEKEERTVTRRYAGYQVQPAKTLALLKGRGWTVDYDMGLQKVSFHDDLIVTLYSYADWFSPADIEAPTLEEIVFTSRADGKTVPLEDIDPILFSEIMRDIDLVVSVAYVGGVDAETSHSTVELRIAVAKELVKLLKLNNVEFLERHARIHGKLGTYSVHMGSGIVHAEGKGMLGVLPVHSQQRGRIFLPFADEDPKTAEIMSKIILFSEDTKIKDPTILDQLR